MHRSSIMSVRMLSVLGSIAVAAPVLAQPAAETDPGEDIVVTAQKRAERLQDTPVAVSAFNQDALDRLGVRDVASLARAVPSLNLSSFRGAEVYVNMRGLSTGYGLSPAVSLYVDETPMDLRSDAYSGTSLVEPFDLERIEVLRGPQGTLLGSSSLGGAIRIVTARPDFSGVDVRAEVGGYGTKGGDASYSFRAAVNVPLAANVALRLVATHRRDGGWIDRSGETNFFNVTPGAPITARNENDSETTSFRAALRFSPDDTINITPSFIHQTTRTKGIPVYFAQAGTFVRPHALTDRGRFDLTVAALKIEKDFGGVSLVSASSYLEKDTLGSEDYTGFVQYLAAAFGLGQVYVPNTIDAPVDYRQVAQEVRLVSNGDGPLRWVVGGYFNHIRQSNRNFIVSPDFVPLFGTDNLYTYDSPATDRQLAAFGEVTFLPLPQVELTAGLRGYDLKQSVRISQSGLLAGGNSPRTISSSSGVTKRFTAAYKPSDDVNLYATYSEGFRPGGPNIGIAFVPGCTYLDAFKTTYAPDTVRNYEVGAKLRANGGRFTLNGAAYQLDWSGVQGQVNSTCGVFVANIGKARVQGVELETSLRLFDGLQLFGQFSYNDARIRRIDPLVAGSGVGSPGQSVINVPKWQYGLSAVFETPLSGSAQFFIEPSWQHVGSAGTSYVDPSVRRPAYDNVDLRTGVRFEAIELAVFARNLTNDLQILGNDRNAVFGYNSYLVSRPRWIGVSASFDLKR